MFKERVLKVVSAIPKGKTLSYGEVAVLAGSLRAYRAVGTILKGNHDPKIPCHRVIKSDGSVGNYNGGTWRKRKLLIQEGSI